MEPKISITDIAYIGGLFDGEGCVTYSKRRQKKAANNKHYNFWDIRCEISMTDKYVMEWLYTTLGFGAFNERKPTKSWIGKKTQWRWRCSHRDALIFAKLIWPYAQVKMHKLEQIIDHYEPEHKDTNVISLEAYRK
jgi:hypothetical protein